MQRRRPRRPARMCAPFLSEVLSGDKKGASTPPLGDLQVGVFSAPLHSVSGGFLERRKEAEPQQRQSGRGTVQHQRWLRQGGKHQRA